MSDDGNFCCRPDFGDCCGPGSWCCSRAGKHGHPELDEPTPIHDSIHLPWDKEKCIAFRKTWDARVEEAMSR